MFRKPWHALGLQLTLPLVLGLVALGGDDEQTFADGALLGASFSRWFSSPSS